MPVSNIFNKTISTTADTVVLTGVPLRKWRVRQLNIQNQDATLSTNVTVKSSSNSETIIGPIKIPAGALLTLELASYEPQQIFILEEGADLVLNSSQAVTVQIFGFAGLA